MKSSPGRPTLDHALILEVAEAWSVSLADLGLGDGPGDDREEDAGRSDVHAVVAGSESFEGGDDFVYGLCTDCSSAQTRMGVTCRGDCRKSASGGSRTQTKGQLPHGSGQSGIDGEMRG